LPVCRRQVEPHAQIPRCVDGIGDATVKSDRSAEVLRHFGLGRTIGFQTAASDTSGRKHPESSHQLTVRSRCLRRIVNTDATSVWYIHVRRSLLCRLSLHVRVRDATTAPCSVPITTIRHFTRIRMLGIFSWRTVRIYTAISTQRAHAAWRPIGLLGSTITASTMEINTVLTNKRDTHQT